jgi:hypothetical protein
LEGLCQSSADAQTGDGMKSTIIEKMGWARKHKKAQESTRKHKKAQESMRNTRSTEPQSIKQPNPTNNAAQIQHIVQPA